jgi:DNA-binding PadR family transcriptional regulator
MQKNAQDYLPLTEATFLILISLTESKHGYAIMQDVAAWSGNQAKLGPGTLYGALTKLLDQGLIRRPGENGMGDERRKEYVLTAQGRKVVELECARLETIARVGRRVLSGKEMK